MTDDKTRQLENRIDKLESTIEKMMPSRRDALKMGGAALAGGSLMAGTASAGTNQVGTIGSQASPVDLESEDINNADTVTTQNLVVNGTATGPFGGGAPVLEGGDTITTMSFRKDADATFKTLYSGVAVDVLGGTMVGGASHDFEYTFNDGSTIQASDQTSGAGNYDFGPSASGQDNNGDFIFTNLLPPARNVTDILVGANDSGSAINFGAIVHFKD